MKRKRGGSAAGHTVVQCVAGHGFALYRHDSIALTIEDALWF